MAAFGSSAANHSASREEMKRVGLETAQILKNGEYKVAETGETVRIAHLLRNAVDKTELFTPKQLADLSLPEKSSDEDGSVKTRFEVTEGTSLEAAMELHSDPTVSGSVAVLNFASAKNPGGGFMSGARAQEESLARCTGIFSTLIAEKNHGYYAANNPTRGGFYTDHMIWSPDVPVIRDLKYQFIAHPWNTNFITAPAVNAGTVRKQRKMEPEAMEQEIEKLMRLRIRYVLTIAAARNQKGLVLGAWGCGAFGNEPKQIAQMFADELCGESAPFRGVFYRVVFAILAAKRGEDENVQAFKDAFAGVV